VIGSRKPAATATVSTGARFGTLPAARHQPDQENLMAVQQNKKSPSKRGMHRSHNALVTPGTAIEPTTGEVHLRHHISPTGFYRGRKVLKSKADA
jgi:large subunit ribosomal protein L32